MDEKTIISADGLVVKEFPLNEADKLVTVLTGEYGKISVLARGVKNITSKRASGLSLLNYSTFEFEQKGEKLIYKDSRIKTHFDNIQNDMASFSLAAYICEVASECTFENNDESELLRLCLNTLYAVDKSLKNVPFIKAVFEMKAACVLGFAPETSHCIISGEKLPEKAARVFFGISEGGFISEESFMKLVQAQQTPPECKPVSLTTLAAIRHVAASDQRRMLSFDIDDSSAIEFCDVCESYFLCKSEKKYRSLAYYKKLGNQN